MSMSPSARPCATIPLSNAEAVYEPAVVNAEVLDHDCRVWDHCRSDLVVRSIRSRFVRNAGRLPGLASGGDDPVMNEIPNLVTRSSAYGPVPKGSGIPQRHSSGCVPSFEFSDSLLDERSMS